MSAENTEVDFTIVNNLLRMRIPVLGRDYCMLVSVLELARADFRLDRNEIPTGSRISIKSRPLQSYISRRTRSKIRPELTISTGSNPTDL